MQLRYFVSGICFCVLLAGNLVAVQGGDWIRDFQTKAISDGKSPIAHWGIDAGNYIQWATHSNRLIPVYTFGTKGAGPKVDLGDYMGANSAYRNAESLKKIYGYLPEQTVSAEANYLDQTNIYDLQRAAAAAGKKHIFLIIFDGTDWVTTRAAAIHAMQKVAYAEGRGTGLHFLDYTAGGTSQFGFMVTSAHNEGTDIDVNAQTVKNPGGKIRGGYDPLRGGFTPWATPPNLPYLISLPATDPHRHNYTDSSSSATSMTAGIKTFNGAVNVDAAGTRVETIAHQLQSEGWLVGAVTSVPISHATPAATYAHNVERDDYQDLTRDLLGLKSVSHPEQPLAGLDLLIGTGWGSEFNPAKDQTKIKAQGTNYVQGNPYLTDDDLKTVNAKHGGKYLVATRQAGINGPDGLNQAAQAALAENRRLLGFFGVAKTGHLPFATADGDFNPTVGRSKTREQYTPGDLTENPNLADMTRAALTFMRRPDRKFWLMIEAGDVDWANHDDNLDNSIGAVKSGDAAIKVVTDWVEQYSNWNESLVIVTADHGHLLVLDQPQQLITPNE